MNQKNNYTMIINYIFIFLVINYGILVNFVIKFDDTGYGLILLSWLVLVLNRKSIARIQFNKPIVYWLLWSLYAFLNYYFHPHNNPFPFFVLYRKIFIPLIVLIVVIREYQRHSDKILWLCFITHMIYMVGGSFFDRELINMGNEMTTLGNTYAATSAFTLFYLVLLNRRHKINSVFSIILAIITMIILAMSGTRKAFGAGLVILAFWVMSFWDYRKAGSLFIVLLFIVIGVSGYNKLIQNTFMGERIEMLEEQGDYFLPTDAPAFLQVLGDRAPHYYYGWKSFMDNPIFGNGTGQTFVFQSNIQVYPHSEYVAQLTDGGIVGFGLFALFYSWIVIYTFKRHSSEKAIGRCVLGGLVALLFIYLTTWAWEFSQYFICLGIVIGYCEEFGKNTNISYYEKNTLYTSIL